MRQDIDRTGGMRSPGIAWAFAFSAAAHAALAAALLLWGGAGGFAERGATVVAVDLAPGEPGADGPLDAGEAPAGPRRAAPGFPGATGGEGDATPKVEERAAAALALSGPAAEAGEPAAADAVFAPSETASPGPVAGISAGPAAPGPAGAGPPGPVVVAAGEGAGGGGPASAATGPPPRVEERDGGGGSDGEYGLLRERIESRIVYPEEAVRRGLEGVVLLHIHIETGGIPNEIRIARSSGARILDDAARRGVVRAAPLPSSPGWVEVPVRFRLQ